MCPLGHGPKWLSDNSLRPGMRECPGQHVHHLRALRVTGPRAIIARPTMSDHVLFIEGMSCHHCLNAVNRAIQSVPDVRLTAVAIGRATVDCEPDRLPHLVHAIERAGYRAHPSPPRSSGDVNN